jgi:hypothetical protein
MGWDGMGWDAVEGKWKVNKRLRGNWKVNARYDKKKEDGADSH